MLISFLNPSPVIWCWALCCNLGCCLLVCPVLCQRSGIGQTELGQAESFHLPSLGSRQKAWLLVALMADPVGPRLYSCCKCRNQVALHDDVISKAFQGRHGRAFLFSHAMNIEVGPKEDRNLTTGLHTVTDIYCQDCREVLGWKYERAYEQTQKYKEGKFILEKSKIAKENW